MSPPSSPSQIASSPKEENEVTNTDVSPPETTQNDATENNETILTENGSEDVKKEESDKVTEESTNGDAAKHDHKEHEAEDLLTDAQLKERYGDKYELNEAAKLDIKATRDFLYYTVKRFVLGRNIPRTRDQIVQMARENKSDYEIYAYMRELQQNELKLKTVKEKGQKLRSVEKEKYTLTIDTKVKQLKGTLEDFDIRTGKDCKVQKVLDIGTEKLEFLDSLHAGLQLKENGGCVNGINIDDGFCHYDADLFQNNTKDTRFQLYDGKTIPFPNGEFDLITMYSVIHHIPTENFKEVAKDIARVCGKMLFIKDVDMGNRVVNIFFRLQHYLYEGILTPGRTSYLNDEVTMKNTLQILQDVGFEIADKRDVQNFNGTYFALLRKKDFILPPKRSRKRPRENDYQRGPPRPYQNPRGFHQGPPPPYGYNNGYPPPPPYGYNSGYPPPPQHINYQNPYQSYVPPPQGNAFRPSPYRGGHGGRGGRGGYNRGGRGGGYGGGYSR